MTDEEMAEEYADNISGLELTCSLLSAKDKSHAYRLGRYEGFLAGLKAGRPQCNDLRKDPKDLPSDKHGHVVINQDWDKVTIRNGRFEFLDGCKADVIAWCELPTFDKE